MKIPFFKKKGSAFLGDVLMALVYLFLYAPLIVMVVFSFNGGKSTAVLQGFSLRWYQELFSGGELLECLKNSLLLAVVSSVIATVE
jgi:spermidine/putrescine transport system permease protein